MVVIIVSVLSVYNHRIYRPISDNPGRNTAVSSHLKREASSCLKIHCGAKRSLLLHILILQLVNLEDRNGVVCLVQAD